MASFCKQFLSNFLLLQQFDLPDSMIYHILKNPKSSKVYQKLIQCCKYFFVKNPILVFHCLEIDDDGWKICKNQGNCKEDDFQQRIDSRIFSSCCKLWIDHRILIISTESNTASDLAPKIYKCDAIKAWFANQKMSLQQFLLYSQNVKLCVLKQVIVSSDVCAEIPLEEIIANLPNILRILFKYGHNSKNASSDTVEKLLQIPHFKNITEFFIQEVSPKFNSYSLDNYYTNNKSRVTFAIEFNDDFSEGSVSKIQKFLDEILDYKFHKNVTSLIGYPGLPKNIQAQYDQQENFY